MLSLDYLLEPERCTRCTELVPTREVVARVRAVLVEHPSCVLVGLDAERDPMICLHCARMQLSAAGFVAYEPTPEAGFVSDMSERIESDCFSCSRSFRTTRRDYANNPRCEDCRARQHVLHADPAVAVHDHCGICGQYIHGAGSRCSVSCPADERFASAEGAP